MIHSTFEKVNIDKKFAFLKVFCYICTQTIKLISLWIMRIFSLY